MRAPPEKGLACDEDIELANQKARTVPLAKLVFKDMTARD